MLNLGSSESFILLYQPKKRGDENCTLKRSLNFNSVAVHTFKFGFAHFICSNAKMLIYLVGKHTHKHTHTAACANTFATLLAF